MRHERQRKACHAHRRYLRHTENIEHAPAQRVMTRVGVSFIIIIVDIARYYHRGARVRLRGGYARYSARV